MAFKLNSANPQQGCEHASIGGRHESIAEARSTTDATAALPPIQRQSGLARFPLLKAAVVAIGVFSLSGCMDGPFYSLKSANPYFLSQWREDRKLGETFDDRMAELAKVENRIPRMEPVERDEWAFRLEKIIQDEPSPEMRCQAIRCLAKMDSPVVDRSLQRACTDEVDKVRMFACNALKQSSSAQAKDMLLTVAKSDTSNSVRQAAVDSLASFDDPDVIRSLGSMLDDQSPAIQKSVADSLAQITGEQFGGDMDRWKTLVDSIAPPLATDSNTRFASGPNELPGSVGGIGK